MTSTEPAPGCGRTQAKVLLALAMFLVPATGRTQSDCERDLEHVISTLEADYPGHLLFKERWPDVWKDAVAHARSLVEERQAAECDAVLRELLAVFRDGHLLLHSDSSPAVDMPPPLFAENRTPKAWALDDETFVVRAPSFAVGYKEALDGLLAQHEQEIRARSLLIVDVRGNTGGGDGTWTELVKPIYAGPMRRWPVQWRVSEGNARALDGQADALAASGNGAAAVCDGLRGIAAAMREEREPMASLGPQLGTTATLDEVWPMPERVAILIDGACGSSCENFLLAARQSDKVRLFGANTFGAVDFQNGRLEPLPSGRRRLQFGMTMSTRLLTEQELHRGIAPDEALPEEVLRDPDAALVEARERMR